MQVYMMYGFDVGLAIGELKKKKEKKTQRTKVEHAYSATS